MSGPEISVLIPAYNEEASLGRVLVSVHESFAAMPERTYEVVVCNNNSTDRTAEIASANGARVVFEEHNQIARARNAAARAADGQWFIFLDGDTLLNPHTLSRAVHCLGSGKTVAGGATVTFDQPAVPPFAAGLTRIWNTTSALLGLAAGSFVFCTREACLAVGGFDEEFYAGEEIFFSRKLKQWGRRRGLRFTVITDAPVVTSARKLEWFSQWQLLRRMLLLALPGALKRRDRCGLWYTRPVSLYPESGPPLN